MLLSYTIRHKKTDGDGCLFHTLRKTELLKNIRF